MIARPFAVARRASLEPLLLRLGVFGTALAALLLAAPEELAPGWRWALAALAVLPALRPGGGWVTVLVLVAVAAWLVDTGLTVVAGARPAVESGGVVPDPGRLLVLAALLYLCHILAAVVAVLPYDAVVAPDVVTRWLLRATGVVVVSAVLSAAVLAGLTRLVDGRAYLTATLVGLALAVGAVALLRSRVRADRG